MEITAEAQLIYIYIAQSFPYTIDSPLDEYQNKKKIDYLFIYYYRGLWNHQRWIKFFCVRFVQGWNQSFSASFFYLSFLSRWLAWVSLPVCFLPVVRNMVPNAVQIHRPIHVPLPVDVSVVTTPVQRVPLTLHNMLGMCLDPWPPTTFVISMSMIVNCPIVFVLLELVPTQINHPTLPWPMAFTWSEAFTPGQLPTVVVLKSTNKKLLLHHWRNLEWCLSIFTFGPYHGSWHLDLLSGSPGCCEFASCQFYISRSIYYGSQYNPNTTAVKCFTPSTLNSILGCGNPMLVSEKGGKAIGC